MKNHRIRGTSSAGRRVLRFAVGSVPDGQWQNYRVFSERQPPVSTLTSAISPSAPCYTATEG